MITRDENDLLCRVEGNAPMGQIMRRHWMPACMSEELPDPDGTPIPVRLLGEDLVAWRDSEGRVGLMHRYCAHRNASLVFARNEDCGLRCLYHGWKFDVTGSVIEMPSEPAGSCMAEKVKLKAYPTHEHGGFVWTYMGPKESMPEFEPPPFAPSEHAKVSIAKIIVDCNWAQIVEGGIDSAHSSSLHSSDITPSKGDRTKTSTSKMLRPTTDMAPRIQVKLTDYGLKYAAIRRPIHNADSLDYVRMTIFVAPFLIMVPPTADYGLANINIPIDDTHTAYYFIAWNADGTGGIDQEDWRKFLGAQVGVDLYADFTKIRTKDNLYMQDRALMKTGNFTGIRGIPHQDIAMQESMGAIAERSNDRLGASDLCIVEFRRLMVEAAQQYQNNGEVIGASKSSRNRYRFLRAFEGMLPKGSDWTQQDQPQKPVHGVPSLSRVG